MKLLIVSLIGSPRAFAAPSSSTPDTKGLSGDLPGAEDLAGAEFRSYLAQHPFIESTPGTAAPPPPPREHEQLKDRDDERLLLLPSPSTKRTSISTMDNGSRSSAAPGEQTTSSSSAAPAFDVGTLSCRNTFLDVEGAPPQDGPEHLRRAQSCPGFAPEHPSAHPGAHHLIGQVMWPVGRSRFGLLSNGGELSSKDNVNDGGPGQHQHVVGASSRGKGGKGTKGGTIMEVEEAATTSPSQDGEQDETTTAMKPMGRRHDPEQDQEDEELQESFAGAGAAASLLAAGGQLDSEDVEGQETRTNMNEVLSRMRQRRQQERSAATILAPSWVPGLTSEQVAPLLAAEDAEADLRAEHQTFLKMHKTTRRATTAARTEMVDRQAAASPSTVLPQIYWSTFGPSRSPIGSSAPCSPSASSDNLQCSSERLGQRGMKKRGGGGGGDEQRTTATSGTSLLSIDVGCIGDGRGGSEQTQGSSSTAGPCAADPRGGHGNVRVPIALFDALAEAAVEERAEAAVEQLFAGSDEQDATPPEEVDPWQIKDPWSSSSTSTSGHGGPLKISGQRGGRGDHRQNKIAASSGPAQSDLEQAVEAVETPTTTTSTPMFRQMKDVGRKDSAGSTTAGQQQHHNDNTPNRRPSYLDYAGLGQRLRDATLSGPSTRGRVCSKLVFTPLFRSFLLRPDRTGRSQLALICGICRQVWEKTDAKLRMRGHGSGHMEGDGDKEGDCNLQICVTGQDRLRDEARRAGDEQHGIIRVPKSVRQHNKALRMLSDKMQAQFFQPYSEWLSTFTAQEMRQSMHPQRTDDMWEIANGFSGAEKESPKLFRSGEEIEIAKLLDDDDEEVRSVERGQEDVRTTETGRRRRDSHPKKSQQSRRAGAAAAAAKAVPAKGQSSASSSGQQAATASAQTPTGGAGVLCPGACGPAFSPPPYPPHQVPVVPGTAEQPCFFPGSYFYGPQFQAEVNHQLQQLQAANMLFPPPPPPYLPPPPMPSFDQFCREQQWNNYMLGAGGGAGGGGATPSTAAGAAIPSPGGNPCYCFLPSPSAGDPDRESREALRGMLSECLAAIERELATYHVDHVD